MSGVVESQIKELKALWRDKRQLAMQVLNLAMIVFSALMIWKSLMVCPKRIACGCRLEWEHGACLSERRYPVSEQCEEDLDVGDIVVFKIQGRRFHCAQDSHCEPCGKFIYYLKKNKV